jgi:hypothetical protein
VALGVAGASAQQVRPPPIVAQQVNIKDYGAIGDGTCHQLSSFYRSLAAARRVYPFVSDLTQCIDWAATQQAINSAFNNTPTANDSAPVYCPVGAYQLSNPIFFDQPNNTQSTYSAWASGKTYGNGANVKYNGIPWVSLGSGNVGNSPTSSNNFPSQIQVASNSNTPTGSPWAVVSISNASPAVITVVGGGNIVVANQPVVFFTQLFANPNGGSSPALPTGINANQVYYVVGASITGTSFQVSATPGGGGGQYV